MKIFLVCTEMFVYLQRGFVFVKLELIIKNKMNNN
jgi:hypothetical protein